YSPGRAVRLATAQALYGLSFLLDRGILHHPPIAPALRRQLALAVPPADLLLAGCNMVLGQPLGVGQGANPPASRRGPSPCGHRTIPITCCIWSRRPR